MALSPNDEVCRIGCPQCNFQLDPIELAKLLPLEVLNSERARRNGAKPRRNVAGPGRPKGIARCPSCAGVFGLPQFREHFPGCLSDKLNSYRMNGTDVQLKPIDATDYKEFRVKDVRDETVVFHKLSNSQDVEVPLRTIREVSPAVNGEPAVITLRGALRWKQDIQRWRYSTE